MIVTLDNCQEWFEQQPEVVYFVQTDYQGDEFMKKLVRREMSEEQWDKMVARFSNREIHRIEFENVDGKPHCWVYFREGE